MQLAKEKRNGNGNRVLDLIKKGQREPTLIALRTGLSVREVTEKVQEAVRPKGPLEILKSELTEACDMLQIAKTEYETDPTMYNATAYTQILKEVQSLIEKIEAFHDPSKAAHDVLVIVQALTRTLIQATTESLNHVRSKVPRTAHPEIDASFRKFGHQVAQRYSSAADQIRVVMGVEGIVESIHDINIEEIKRSVTTEQ